MVFCLLGAIGSVCNRLTDQLNKIASGDARLFRETAIAIRFIRPMTSAVLTTVLLSMNMASAQSNLPAPSRSIYKCKINGTVSYSDEPCLGAQRLDATPTSGVSHLSGSPRIGKDVANELHREQFATAIRPLSGMSASQLATATRRYNLDLAARRECNQLEPAIVDLEHEEKKETDAAAIGAIQQNLYALRKRYKTLQC